MRFKYLLTLLFVYAISSNSEGQEVFMGLRAGYGVSNVSATNEGGIDIESRYSPSLALLYNVRFYHSNWGISFEPGYTLKGVQIDDNTLDYRFNYWNLPVLMEYYLSDKIRVSAGPEISFLSSSINKINDSTSVSLRDTYDKKWEFGAAAGLAYSVTFYADIGFRYNASFSRISEFDPRVNRRDIHNQYFQIFFLLKILN